MRDAAFMKQLQNSIVNVAGEALFELYGKGITFSERESRELILREFPDCPEEILVRILQKVGFP